MKIHEYQAKQLFKEYAIPIPKGKIASNPIQARANAEEIGGAAWAVKAQIHAGGRGKAGGVKLARTLEEVEKFTKNMLGSILITNQTNPEGKKVLQVLVEQEVKIIQEYYLGITLERQTSKNVIIASSQGGMDIEEISQKNPETIFKIPIDPFAGIKIKQIKELSKNLNLSNEKTNEQFSHFLNQLYKLFLEKDCSLLEVNPLVLTNNNNLLCLDAKVIFDDNGIFKHPELLALRDVSEEDPLEVDASKFKLNYIKLNGNIGCMVNGAGLAMATMDLIKQSGGLPANFLDVGGGTNVERVASGFRILSSDQNVRSVFINIFGGIVRCDLVAQGILEALKLIKLKVPIIIRLEGTNASAGLALLKKSSHNFIIENSFEKAALKAVKATG